MNRLKKVLILGSGALKIGQAGEFDYSGSQAIKALKEEGIKTVLINPNIATIQTSENMADKVYFLPVDSYFVTQIIKKEKPDGILLAFGGQTALNCGIELARKGILKKYQVKVLGTPIQAIKNTEDRDLFVKKLTEINLKVPKSFAVKSVKEAIKAAEKISYPIMIRIAYALGGLGSGVVKHESELKERAQEAFCHAKQILVEEYLEGWKEIEYEVVRDSYDNCITVCNMENFDPMGVHTGESIVVAPSQTLTNSEYHKLREIAIKVIKHLGIVGECNIQYALDPKSEDYRIIEVNARLSRSSALASKATGYPLAFIAAKLALGYSLTELENKVTKKTKACFEPALDYVVVKMPRWDLAKFKKVRKEIGSEMKSVGEVMAIGRKFGEALQKAIRMLQVGMDGLVANNGNNNHGHSESACCHSEQSPTKRDGVEESLLSDFSAEFRLQADSSRNDKRLDQELKYPTDGRLFAIVNAFKKGYSSDQIHQLSRIDKWFLEKIHNIVKMESKLKKYNLQTIKFISSHAELVSASKIKNEIPYASAKRQQVRDDSDKDAFKDLLREAKQLGFSDKQLAVIWKKNELEIRELRKKLKLFPVVKQIDTLAGEFPAKTNYLYLTYNGEENDICDTRYATHSTSSRSSLSLPFEALRSPQALEERAHPSESKTGQVSDKPIIILGSGAYKIGSSVEFDWCCVNAAQTAKRIGYKTIMINYNPETVSTDYDICDKLYFDELSFEVVADIYEKEKPKGMIVSMGGQIPNNLSLQCHKFGLRVLGTSPKSIDQAEDRHKFSALLDKLGVDQPKWREVTSIQKAKSFAKRVEYPVLIRPSYVLSGAAMNIAPNEKYLELFLKKAEDVNPEHPVVISKFITNAKEIEIDAVAKNGEIVVYAISEHVENAGVHSGDATMVFPAQRLYLVTVRRIKKIARAIAKNLKITGPFNIQFLAKNNQIKVIECNLRASRSFPFVSKVSKTNFIEIATRSILNYKLPKLEKSSFELDYVGVKAPQFSFSRLKGADPALGVEMASTGEVACFGEETPEAFLKSILSVGYNYPKKNILFSIGGSKNKYDLLDSVKRLYRVGYNIYATDNTSKFLESNGIKNTLVYKVSNSHPNKNVLAYLETKKIDMVINIPNPDRINKEIISDGYHIRRTATDFAIPLVTNVQLAKLFIKALVTYKLSDLEIKSWQEY